MNLDPDTALYLSHLIDLDSVYTVGANKNTGAPSTALQESKPFIHEVKLHGPKGEIVRIRGVFDDGAMINAIDSEIFDKIRHRLSDVKSSARKLRMADGSIVPSSGNWSGLIKVEGVRRDGSFEIFPSGGLWGLLFRKPLLRDFQMTHQYEDDVITLPGSAKAVVNELGQTRDALTAVAAGVSLTSDVQQREFFRGNGVSPCSQVLLRFTATKGPNDEAPATFPDHNHNSDPGPPVVAEVTDMG